jgi:uncharacterized membrane protein YhaH (DUF805 family)
MIGSSVQPRGSLQMNAYLYCMRHYADFSGRASRSEYWLFVLIFFIIYAVCFALDYNAIGIGPSGIPPLTLIAYLAHFVPGLAVLVRRLHDIDRSGWWLLISLVPVLGSIWLLVLLCSEGTYGPNEYGPNPNVPYATQAPPLRY